MPLQIQYDLIYYSLLIGFTSGMLYSLFFSIVKRPFIIEVVTDILLFVLISWIAINIYDSIFHGSFKFYLYFFIIFGYILYIHIFKVDFERTIGYIFFNIITLLYIIYRKFYSFIIPKPFIVLYKYIKSFIKKSLIIIRRKGLKKE